jgi:hypothetical protein
MKFIFIYFYVLFLKIIESFKPFITRCVFYKTNKIIKSLSGLLQNIPYITSKKEVNNSNVNDNKVKILIGYMEHDPKKEAAKKINKIVNFWNKKVKLK